jgi:hypothetical protein
LLLTLQKRKASKGSDSDDDDDDSAGDKSDEGEIEDAGSDKELGGEDGAAMNAGDDSDEAEGNNEDAEVDSDAEEQSAEAATKAATKKRQAKAKAAAKSKAKAKGKGKAAAKSEGKESKADADAEPAVRPVTAADRKKAAALKNEGNAFMAENKVLPRIAALLLSTFALPLCSLRRPLTSTQRPLICRRRRPCSIPIARLPSPQPASLTVCRPCVIGLAGSPCASAAAIADSARAVLLDPAFTKAYCRMAEACFKVPIPILVRSGHHPSTRFVDQAGRFKDSVSAYEAALEVTKSDAPLVRELRVATLYPLLLIALVAQRKVIHENLAASKAALARERHADKAAEMKRLNTEHEAALREGRPLAGIKRKREERETVDGQPDSKKKRTRTERKKHYGSRAFNGPVGPNYRPFLSW